jgi:hypothetical protein
MCHSLNLSFPTPFEFELAHRERLRLCRIFLTVVFERAAEYACRKVAGLKKGGQQQQKQGVLREELKDEADAKKISLVSRQRVAARPTVNRMLLLSLLIAAT